MLELGPSGRNCRWTLLTQLTNRSLEDELSFPCNLLQNSQIIPCQLMAVHPEAILWLRNSQNWSVMIGISLMSHLLLRDRHTRFTSFQLRSPMNNSCLPTSSPRAISWIRYQRHFFKIKPLIRCVPRNVE